MKKFIIFIKLFTAVITVLLFAQCKEEINQPVTEGGNVPGLVTGITEIPLPGGAELHYKLPNDKNLMYVEVEVNTPEGRYWNFKASSYASSIIIMGLATGNEQLVKIYSVSTSGLRSEAIDYTIHPLEPPFRQVFRTLKLSQMWGGVMLTYKNDSKTKLDFLLGYYDNDGEYVEWDGYYPTKTNTDTIHVFRGLQPVQRRFGIYIRDRYGNYSDTLFTNVTPLNEEEISKKDWKRNLLDNDGPLYPLGHIYYETNKIENLWDGAWSKSFSDPYMLQLPSAYMTFTIYQDDNPTDASPRSVTFDMGDVYRISRIRINHYWQYEFTAARQWEIWGSSSTPPQNGDWNWEGWEKLADMEQIKPSGLPGKSYGDGDAEAWEAGTSADIPPEVYKKARYIRIKCLKSWGTVFPAMSCAEITMYGTKN